MERAASLFRPMIVHTFCHLHFPPFGGTLCLRSQSQRGRSLAPSSPFPALLSSLLVRLLRRIVSRLSPSELYHD